MATLPIDWLAMMHVFCCIVAASKNPDAAKCPVPYGVDDMDVFFPPKPRLEPACTWGLVELDTVPRRPANSK